MYELKTKPTDKDVMDVIAAIAHEQKQADAKKLLDIFQMVTGKPPVVWGDKQIGFGSYRYRYVTGNRGEIYTTGFSVTRRGITLYLMADEPVLHDCLKRLGKATAGKSCVYVNKLSDIDTDVLADMIAAAVRFVQDSTFTEPS